MRIVQVVSSVDAEASGPAYTVPRLCRALGEQGQSVDLFSLGKASASVSPAHYKDTRFPNEWSWMPIVRRLGTSRALRDALEKSSAQVFHTHGLWMLPNVYPTQVSSRLTHVVLSPRGMLGREAFQFSRIKKKAFWVLAQKSAVQRVKCFHATADQEYEDIRQFGLSHPVAVIPNGIDLPMIDPSNSDKSGQPYVLSLGRIHPKKALDRLIRAWALLSSDFPNWRLKLVGPNQVGYVSQLERLIRQLKIDTVDISGPIFGEAKTKLLAKAELFALPTLHENFGMTVAESLAVSTPVIATKGAPWAGLETHGCGWWVEHGVEPLAHALRQAMSLSPDRRISMGHRGKAWMKRDFAWDGVAVKMINVYQWLSEGGDRPACVKLD